MNLVGASSPTDADVVQVNLPNVISGFRELNCYDIVKSLLLRFLPAFVLKLQAPLSKFLIDNVGKEGLREKLHNAD